MTLIFIAAAGKRIIKLESQRHVNFVATIAKEAQSSYSRASMLRRKEFEAKAGHEKGMATV